MLIQDLRDGQVGTQIETDLCIIGSGPAGLTIAGELAGSGLRILVVESGGLAEEAETDSLNEVESIGAPRIMEQTLVRNRAFGGTSRSWSGRCTPLDAMDFAVRDWVPFSGWPVDRDSLGPYVDRAATSLGLDRIDYEAEAGLPAPEARAFDPELLRYCLWQFSADRSRRLDFMRFGPAFLARQAAGARILLHATVTDLRLDEAGRRAVGADVAAINGPRATIGARVIVLCAGGIENARILLYSDRPAGGVGNRTGMVGKFLMDHPRCTLGSFDPARSHDIRERFGLFRAGGRSRGPFRVRGVTPSPRVQERRQMLNCAAWLTEYRAPDDPWDAAKRLVSGRDRNLARDGWRVVSQPGLITRGAAARLLHGRGVSHKVERLVMDCIVEQRPDPESRVVLSDRTDRLGLPQARLDWRVGRHERETVAAFADLICTEFRRTGLTAPHLAEEITAADPVFIDASHPIGTTRMADTPQAGVVDAQCQVHGVGGLYVGGSSVFPTTGHANPTLMIVALAIRLAEHIRRHEFSPAGSPEVKCQPGMQDAAAAAS